MCEDIRTSDGVQWQRREPTTSENRTQCDNARISITPMMIRIRKQNRTILLLRNLTRIRNNHSFETILAAANHAAFKSSTCPCPCERECAAMSPNPGTLCAAAVMLSSAVCSGLAGIDAAVSDSTERRRESECEPMPRAPAISRMETKTVPTVSNFARPKG